jgi:signal transduction histidine kinase/CheY-like chemotaxis protein
MRAAHVAELAHSSPAFTDRDSLASAMDELVAGWPAIVMMTGEPHLVLPWDAVGHSENRRLVDLPLEHAVVIEPATGLEEALSVMGDAKFFVTRTSANTPAVVSRRALVEALVAGMRDVAGRGLGEIVDQLPEGVAVIGEDDQIEHLNPAARDLLACLGSYRVGDRLVGFGGVPLAKFIDDACAGTPRDVSVVEPDARIFSVRTLRPADRPNAKTVLVLRDVTHVRHRQARESTQERLALLGQLTSGIAHDFNNLLTVIMGHASNLAERGEPPAFRADGRAIQGAAIKASHLVQRLLGFSRREVVRTVLLDLRETLEELGSLMRRIVGERIDLDVTVAPDLWPVSADPVQVERVIANLIVNARNAMPHGGHLTIEASNDPDASRLPRSDGPTRAVRIAVRDTGHGMDAETRAHIFDPYFTRGAEGGFGLGLTTVAATISELGGDIEVQSTVDVGTVFTITLPAADGSLPEGEARRKGADVLVGSGRVLVVEDDLDVAAVVWRTLEGAGYAARVLGSGEEAAALVDTEGAPDLLIVDAILRSGSGIQVAKQLRKRAPRLRVLLMSGYAEVDVVAEGRAAFAEFIAKPFSGRELLERVAALVGVGDDA